MQTGFKAGLALGTSVAIGAILGAMGAGLWLDSRREPPPRPPNAAGPEGGRGMPEGGRGDGRGAAPFVEFLEQDLAPKDSAQRTALHALLVERDMANRAIVDGARKAMGAGMKDSLRPKLAKLLDAEQMKRFDDFIERSQREGRGPPGLEGSDRGGRGDGRRGRPGGDAGRGGRGPPP